MELGSVFRKHGSGRSLLKLFLIAASTVFIYGQVSRIWMPSTSVTIRSAYSEIPIIFVLLAITCAGSRRYQTARMLAVVLAVVLIYGLHDAFLLGYGQTPTYSNFYDFPLLFHVDLKLAVLGSALFLTVAMLLAGALFIHQRLILRRVLLFAGFLVFLQSSGYAWYAGQVLHFVYTDDIRNIGKNGRLSIFISNSLRERNAVARLQSYKHESDASFCAETIKLRRNIYVFVLESFVNPWKIRGLDIAPLPREGADPTHDWLDSGNVALSPVYGGMTPQAEFELLTGVPARQEFGPIEFNILTKGQVKSWVSYLRENGYRTIANKASSPAYFKGEKPYRCLGFEEVNFYDSSKREEDRFLLDQPYFSQLDKRIAALQGSPQNYLFYSLTVYGHYPFERDRDIHPDVYTLRANGAEVNEKTSNVVNMMYYRVLEVRRMLASVMARDPQAIIIAISDHLPAILGSNLSYRGDQHENFVKLFVDGAQVNIDKLHYYQIPYLLTRYLQADCAPGGEQLLTRKYYDIHASGIGIN